MMATWLFDCISKIRRKTENGNQDVETSLKTRLWVDLRQLHFLNPLVSLSTYGSKLNPQKKMEWHVPSALITRGVTHRVCLGICAFSTRCRENNMEMPPTSCRHPQISRIHAPTCSSTSQTRKATKVRGTFASTDSLTAIWWLAEQPVNVNKSLPLGAFAAFFPRVPGDGL